MSRLLLFNLRTDADDHILGFTTQWINAFAQHYDAVDVLTMHAGRIAVAPNVTVYSVGREHGYSEARRLARFCRLLFMLLARHRYTACFAHMQPLFAALAGVALRLRGVPLTTWYTHRQRTRQLAWAVRLSRRVVSAVPDSFPISTPKLRVTGHGIDTTFFSPDRQNMTSPPLQEETGLGRVDTALRGEVGRPLIVYVARLTDIKNQATLLRAVVPLDCEVALVGDIPDGFEASYKHTLHRLVDELGITDRVTFAGAQTAEQVREWYQRAAAAVNLAPPGLFDKAALESMACGLPTIVSNPAFAPVTQPYEATLHVDSPDDHAALSEKLSTLLALPPVVRQRIGRDVRARIIALHSLDALIARLVKILNTGEM
jgi:glycosyltransferase involved in cell wall biosynthesis